MPKSRLKNSLHYFRHKVLRLPIRLAATSDTRLKQPRLTVVFLHGISATSDTWKDTIREFKKDPDLKNQVRLVTLDLLGFGKSLQADWLDYDYLDYEKALHAALKRLRPHTPIVLVGHSMGALIAADYATNFNQYAHTKSADLDTKRLHKSKTPDVTNLILISPPVLLEGELARLPDQVYAKSYGALNQLAKDEPSVGIIAAYIQKISSFKSRYLKTPAFGRSMENIILNRHNYHTFAHLKIPTLIIHGHFDPLVMRSNLKKVAEVNPRHVRYVGAMGHHDISASKRNKILTELKQILKEQA